MTKNDLDTVDVIKEAHEKTRREKIKDTRIKYLCEQYVATNGPQVRLWIEKNPGQRLPLFYIEEEDRIVWLTRKMRREMAKAKGRG